MPNSRLLTATALITALLTASCSSTSEGNSWSLDEAWTTEERAALEDAILEWGQELDHTATQKIWSAKGCARGSAGMYLKRWTGGTPQILICKRDNWTTDTVRLVALHELGHHVREDWNDEFHHLPDGNVMQQNINRNIPAHLTDADRTEKATLK